jgi:hypothetical protein
LLALLVGGAVAVAGQSRPAVVAPLSAAPSAASQLAALAPNDAPAAAVRSNEGFSVQLQGVNKSDGKFVAYYRLETSTAAGFAEMLGIPRIVNPDGSFVLPSEYGTVGAASDTQGGIPGLPAGSSGGIFDSAGVQPNAVLRFGPFFRALPDGLTVKISGSELLAGRNEVFSGERFTISASNNKDGTITVSFVDIEQSASVVVSHPRSRVSVLVDGVAQEEIHGSTNFAKTDAFDVNANTSTVVVKGQISPTNNVVITSTSIGRVFRGSWDFPLD